MDLTDLQAQQALWAAHNFGADAPATDAFLGVVEEVGELAHAILQS